MLRGKGKIGLRAFLFVTTVGTALSCTLFLWYRGAADEAATVDGLRRGGHGVYYECDLGEDGNLPTTPGTQYETQFDYDLDRAGLYRRRPRTQMERLLSVPGDSAFFDVELVNMRYDARDDELEKVCRFTKLKKLHVVSGLITDRGAKSLTRLHSLRHLSLLCSRVTDVGLGNIAQVTDLEELNLAGTSITDESVPALASLTKLRTLILVDTDISDDGVRRLREALPESNIWPGTRKENREQSGGGEGGPKRRARGE
jgi:hypothetical protein